MPLGQWNLQWLNHNSQRAYPLTERAAKTDTTGTITLPDSFIVGLYLPVASDVDIAVSNFFIKNVLIAPTGFNVTVGYSDGTTTTDVAAANIVRSNYSPNRSYALGGVDAFADSVGHIVIGQLDEIDALPPGFYTFEPEATPIEPDAIRPTLRAVTSLQILNDSEKSQNIYGHVTLVAGTNIKIDVNNVDDVTEIVISAISGQNLNQDCMCNIPDSGDCIRCINGVCSGDGTFTFAQDSCISITPITNGLSFKDTCATPCCGCSELDAVTSQLNRFGDGITTLQNFVTRLGSEVTQMSLVVLGSNTSNSSCAVS